MGKAHAGNSRSDLQHSPPGAERARLPLQAMHGAQSSVGLTARLTHILPAVCTG